MAEADPPRGIIARENVSAVAYWGNFTERIAGAGTGGDALAGIGNRESLMVLAVCPGPL